MRKHHRWICLFVFQVIVWVMLLRVPPRVWTDVCGASVQRQRRMDTRQGVQRSLTSGCSIMWNHSATLILLLTPLIDICARCSCTPGSKCAVRRPSVFSTFPPRNLYVSSTFPARPAYACLPNFPRDRAAPGEPRPTTVQQIYHPDTGHPARHRLILSTLPLSGQTTI